MRLFKNIAAGSAFLAAFMLACAPVTAQSILFSSQKGDVYFPGLTPAAPGATNQPVTAYPFQVDGTTTRTATATTGAATLNTGSGTITSESLTTAAGATYTLTLTDSDIAATDLVMVNVRLGTATTGIPAIATVTPAAGSVVIVVQNIAASAALNGTIKIAFVDFK